MPSSYLASKPPPNPGLPNWLAWTKNDFFKIDPDSPQVAALVGINRTSELVIIYKPVPVIGPDSSLAAIVGNLNDEKSEPAFIKIDGSSIGSAYNVQNMDEIPEEIRPEIPIPEEFRAGTVFENAPRDVGVCAFPTLAPIPFGSTFSDNHSSLEEFVENMASISPTHKSWAKLIVDTLEQQETDDQHVAVFQKIMSSRDTRTSAIRAATKGIRTIQFSQNPPFTEVSRAANNKFEEELSVLRGYFARNPTPAARVDPNESDEDDVIEVVVRGGNPPPPEQQQQQHQPAHQQQQQQPFQQQQQQPFAQPFQQQPFQQPFQQQPFQQPYVQQNWAQQPSWMPQMQNMMPPNQVWGPQQIIIRSEDEQANLKAVKLQTDMLRLFFVVADCDWEEKKLANIKLPTLTTEMKNILEEPVSVRATQLSNLFQTIFNEVPDNEIDQLNPLYSHMSMTHFDKKFSTGILNARFQYTDLDGAAAYESTEINVFHFGPQSDSSLVNAARIRDANARNEIEFKVHESQRIKTNATIEGIGRVNNIEDVVKVCANLCGIIRSIIDVQGGGYPLLHEFAVKIILRIRSPSFQRWFLKNSSQLAHLHFNFMQKLHHVFVLLAQFSSNSKNTNSIKLNKSTFDSKNLNVAIKYASSFLIKMEEYVSEDSVPTDVPSFARGIVESLKPTETTSAKTLSSSGTAAKPAEDEPDKKKQKKNKKNTDFTKLGLFHAKEGIEDGKVFPSTLKQPLCSKFCLQGKACDKPKQACKFAHVVTWKSIKEEDQNEILKHCVATNNLWLDEETMKKHKTELPKEFEHLLGDATGPKPKKST